MYKDDVQRVFLYVFEKDDGTTDQLLTVSVSDFFTKRGEDVKETEICRDDKGAPYLAGEEMPFVSVSHSGDYTVCAVSDGRIGVDLQVIRPYKDENEAEQTRRLLRLARRFFHPSETEWIEKDPMGRFFTVWSAKESYVKYTGQGIDDDFGMTSVIPDMGPYGTEWECGGMYYRLLPFAEGYSFCVCCERPIETETVFAYGY